MSLSKLFSLPELKEIIDAERKKNKKIALINGDFDLMYAGFVRNLREAKKTADVLIAALPSGKSSKKHGPLIDEKGRVKMISALESIDYAVFFNEDSLARVWETLKPDFYCKRPGDPGDFVPGSGSFSGKIIVLSSGTGSPISAILEKIKTNAAQTENRRREH